MKVSLLAREGSAFAVLGGDDGRAIKLRQPINFTLARMDDLKFREIWSESPDGQRLGALMHGERRWLIYLREEGDEGFSSRNPAYAGAPDEMIEYRLDNGQYDEYPASWALSAPEIERAIQYFEGQRKPPPFICWHNDSGDGVVLEYRDA